MNSLPETNENENIFIAEWPGGQTHLYSEGKFSQEILDLYLNFIKFPVEKVDAQTQGVLTIFESCPIITLGIKLSFFFNTCTHIDRPIFSLKNGFK